MLRTVDEQYTVVSQKFIKLARKLHAHSQRQAVQYAHKVTSTGRASENKSTHTNFGALGPCAARNPPDPH
eukprot:1145510-Pelagomonas_calceolata.AAC.10